MPSAMTSSEDSYFAARSTSTADGSFVSTPNGSLKTDSDEFVSEAPVHPLPAVAREFPKPSEEVNVDEALSRQPGRWTIQGQREANRRREQLAAATRKDEGVDARAQALEAAKKDLMAAYAQMASKSSN
ncbi:hypothetical protein K4F52_003032 [Lecanicillium sp. MT-2017a]|nr:hypothetical protein K4F52_003032 [Lecanicillium sp. MT-2017a]